MCGCGKDCRFSFHRGCHRSTVSPSALNVSPLTQTVAPMWGSDPCLSSPLPQAGPVPLTLLFSSWFLHPAEFCVGLYILFLWSGTPVHSQLLFCMRVYDCRCIYSWRIRGERCTPRPPTPLSSCSPLHMLGSYELILCSLNLLCLAGWAINVLSSLYLENCQTHVHLTAGEVWPWASPAYFWAKFSSIVAIYFGAVFVSLLPLVYISV